MISQKKIEQRVADLRRRAIIIDGHSDILIPVTEGKMALGDRPLVPDPATWRPPMGLERHPFSQFGMGPHTIYFGPMGQYDIPRFQEGGHSDDTILKFLGGNYLRVFEQVWGA